MLRDAFMSIGAFQTAYGKMASCYALEMIHENDIHCSTPGCAYERQESSADFV
jgi:hypothetical protein